MRERAASLSPMSQSEMRVMGLLFTALLAGLMIFNLVILNAWFTPLNRFLYLLLTLAGGGIYALLMPKSDIFVTRYRLWGLIGLFLMGAGLCLGFSLVLGGRAEVYFYLLAYDGYAGFLYFCSGKHRWALIYAATMVTFAGLGYLILWDWQTAWAALLGDLAWFGLAFALAEFTIRQWFQREESERVTAELTRINRQLRDYTAQAEELAVAEERTRIAHEIHDLVGRTLADLDDHLESLGALSPDQVEQRRRAAEGAQALVKRGLADVRRAVKTLRPVMGELPAWLQGRAGMPAADSQESPARE